VSDWAYVAIAYTLVWGSLALYALFLARRVSQAREVSRRLRDSSSSGPAAESRYGESQVGAGGAQTNESDRICDAPPAP